MDTRIDPRPPAYARNSRKFAAFRPTLTVLLLIVGLIGCDGNWNFRFSGRVSRGEITISDAGFAEIRESDGGTRACLGSSCLSEGEPPPLPGAADPDGPTFRRDRVQAITPATPLMPNDDRDLDGDGSVDLRIRSDGIKSVHQFLREGVVLRETIYLNGHETVERYRPDGAGGWSAVTTYDDDGEGVRIGFTRRFFAERTGIVTRREQVRFEGWQERHRIWERTAADQTDETLPFVREFEQSSIQRAGPNCPASSNAVGVGTADDSMKLLENAVLQRSESATSVLFAKAPSGSTRGNGLCSTAHVAALNASLWRLLGNGWASLGYLNPSVGAMVSARVFGPSAALTLVGCSDLSSASEGGFWLNGVGGVPNLQRRLRDATGSMAAGTIIFGFKRIDDAIANRRGARDALDEMMMHELLHAAGLRHGPDDSAQLGFSPYGDVRGKEGCGVDILYACTRAAAGCIIVEDIGGYNHRGQRAMATFDCARCAGLDVDSNGFGQGPAADVGTFEKCGLMMARDGRTARVDVPAECEDYLQCVLGERQLSLVPANACGKMFLATCDHRTDHPNEVIREFNGATGNCITRCPSKSVPFKPNSCDWLQESPRSDEMSPAWECFEDTVHDERFQKTWSACVEPFVASGPFY